MKSSPRTEKAVVQALNLIFRRAKELISDRAHWIVGREASWTDEAGFDFATNPLDKRAVMFCAVGSLRHAAMELGLHDELANTARLVADEYATNYSMRVLPRYDRVASIMELNDRETDACGFHAVHAVIDECINATADGSLSGDSLQQVRFYQRRDAAGYYGS